MSFSFSFFFFFSFLCPPGSSRSARKEKSRALSQSTQLIGRNPRSCSQTRLHEALDSRRVSRTPLLLGRVRSRTRQNRDARERSRSVAVESNRPALFSCLLFLSLSLSLLFRVIRGSFPFFLCLILFIVLCVFIPYRRSLPVIAPCRARALFFVCSSPLVVTRTGTILLRNDGRLVLRYLISLGLREKRRKQARERERGIARETARITS